MTRHIVTPIDGSAASWSAAKTAASLARATNASLTLLTVELDPADRGAALAHLHTGLPSSLSDGLDLYFEVRLASGSVPEQIEAVVERDSGTVVVMSTHGRGRSAALLGSTADDVVRRTFGPVVLLGPNARCADFTGPVVIAVETDDADRTVGLGVAWAIELGSVPWIVHASDTTSRLPNDTIEAGWLESLAHRFGELSGHEIEFESLHGRHPAAEVNDFARERAAALIVAATHARTGWHRITAGSVTSDLVRHATCPVLVSRQAPDRPRPPG